MGSDESNFNVSWIVRNKVIRQHPQTTTTNEIFPLRNSLMNWEAQSTGKKKCQYKKHTTIIECNMSYSVHHKLCLPLIKYSMSFEHLFICYLLFNQVIVWTNTYFKISFGRSFGFSAMFFLFLFFWLWHLYSEFYNSIACRKIRFSQK